MGVRIDNQVTNQLSVPIMLASNYINRPTAGIFGRLFISNDTYQIYQDRVTYWSLIADAGAGSGTLQSVTDNGNTTTAGIYIVGSGTLSVQSLTNGSVLFPSGGSGQISQDNTNFFWDNTNKRLGLGTATPGQRLDVHSSSNITAQFNGTGVTNAVLQLQNAGTSKWSIGNYYNSGNNDFNIYDNVNTTYRAYFTNTGYAIFPSNVIIGSTNRSSSYGLDVYSSAYFRSSIYNLNYTQGSILFAGASGLINQNNSQLFWDNTNNRLGIGTATPSTKLDVNGTLRITSVANASQFMELYTSSGISYYNSQNNSAYYTAFQHIFNTDGTTATERMRITSGGDVVIGDTAAFNAGKLCISVDSTRVTIASKVNVTTGAEHIRFINPNGVVGYISTSGSLTTYSVTSDYRLKQDFKQFEGLNLISNIKTYDYQWKSDNTRMYGVIAHELSEILPYAVNGQKDEIDEDGNPKMQGVDYSKLVPIMVKAIQELNEKLVRNNIN